MMKFVLSEMTYLKYFMPIIIEANKRGLTSQMLVGHAAKYNDPQRFTETLSQISGEHNLEMIPINDGNMQEGLFVTIEGVMPKQVGKSCQVVSLTALADFNLLYRRYIDNVDCVIYPSKFFAEYYKTISDKNVYVGSPKYDVELNNKDIYTKYRFSPADKYVTVFVPNNSETKLVNLKEINSVISAMGYKVITKTRAKHPVQMSDRGDIYLEDYTWYPPTSLELIKISDFIVSFDSSTIKEGIMLDTPIINFKIRKDNKRFPFLYNYDFCVELNPSNASGGLRKVIEAVQRSDYTQSFMEARKKCLFERGDVSKAILDAIL